ncbi:nucleotide disphospho-sugar-binding domain-containing protein [Streptomyces sp. CoH27]|uniref:nucleotide disphospho-sugar-binding domain-containing protein n=1 Tax=Streptomyces sp. CoH27 TaxID=2875763 RepID=UPI001CD5C48A|nr:nucleotide disphospho-sugar-binding domain-containing protein [Streptomyces sp. CoH27]
MRVLFATWAAPGHLFPMVPLAWACQAAGIEVRVAAPPSCQDAVLRTGLPAVAIGPDTEPQRKGPARNARSWGSDRPWPDGWTARPELLDEWQTTVLDYTAGKQVAAAATMTDDLVSFARWWRPDLVVCDALCFAGPVAAAAVGVPHLVKGWELGTLLHTERAGRSGDWLPGYAELFERYGAEPRACSDHLIDTSPPGLRLAESFDVRRTSMRYVPFNGAGTAPPWLAERPRRPRVCVTSGVALGQYDTATATRVTSGLAEAVAPLGIELVIAAGAGLGEALADAAPGARIAVEVPFSLLLPTCDAVIHHGGAGTAMTAVASGVPQLILPQSPPYAEIAFRVGQAGAGTVLDAESDPAGIRAALGDLLEAERYAKALAGLRAEMAAMPPPSEVVTALAALAREGV